jgi:hypothetical protein
MKFLTIANTASDGSTKWPRSTCANSQSAMSPGRYASKRSPPRAPARAAPWPGRARRSCQQKPRPHFRSCRHPFLRWIFGGV